MPKSKYLATKQPKKRAVPANGTRGKGMGTGAPRNPKGAAGYAAAKARKPVAAKPMSKPVTAAPKAAKVKVAKPLAATPAPAQGRAVGRVAKPTGEPVKRKVGPRTPRAARPAPEPRSSIAATPGPQRFAGGARPNAKGAGRVKRAWDALTKRKRTR